MDSELTHPRDLIPNHFYHIPDFTGPQKYWKIIKLLEDDRDSSSYIVGETSCGAYQAISLVTEDTEYHKTSICYEVSEEEYKKGRILEELK